MSATKRWSDLSERSRRLILAAASIEAVLKVAALADISRRPARDLRGPKAAWIVAIILVNSVGALPLWYFFHGRRPARRT